MRSLLVILAAVLIGGCASPGENVGAAAVMPNEAADAILEAESFDVQIGPLVGITTPLAGGCDGHYVGVNPLGIRYERPAGASAGTAVVEVIEGIAPALRFCLFGLDTGVQALVGPPPLSIDFPFANETNITAFALPSNEPAGAVGPLTVRITVTPRR